MLPDVLGATTAALTLLLAGVAATLAVTAGVTHWRRGASPAGGTTPVGPSEVPPAENSAAENSAAENGAAENGAAEIGAVTDRTEAALEGVPRENVAALAHELRTPLAAAVGHLDLVADDEAVGPEHRRTVESAITSLQRASSLLGDFLADPAGWLPDRSVSDPRPVDLHEVVGEALGDFAPLAARRQLSISFDSPGAATVAGDARKLRQVVDNLVSNAVKYAEQGGWIDVRLAVEGDPAEVALELTNPGTTLDDEEAPRVFEPDVRGSGAASRAEGHGIGLAVTHRLVAAHGGEVTLVSSRSTGTTTARFTLPALFDGELSTPGD